MAKGKKQIKVTILYGLPSSGKTFFAKKNSHGDARSVDFDAIIQSHGSNKFSILAELIKQVERKIGYRTNQVIIDGLVTTNQQLRDIIDSLTAGISRFQLVFELVYWKEDRESCLHNDKGRREVSSEISIKNLPYEIPALGKFPEISQKRFVVLKVVRKSPIISWISDLLGRLEYTNFQIEQVTDSMQLRSESWSLGGTWGSWNGHSGTVEAETPLDFKEFDQLLEVVCPSISFLSYKKLKSQCCSITTDSDSDYYGGRTTHSRHICDVKMLYACLQEMGLINID